MVADPWFNSRSCLRKRHITLIFQWCQAVYPLWWPSVMKDLQQNSKKHIIENYVIAFMDMMWCTKYDKPEMVTGRARFFDRLVKPVETQVKFSFLATKRHLSTNRNIQICFIINKSFYKKAILTNHTF